MSKRISVLGSTGSIGRQALDVIRTCGLEAAALTAGHNAKLLEEQVREFKPRLAVLLEESAAKDLRVRVADTGTKVASGVSGLVEAAELDCADTVLTAIVGIAGLRPTMAAIREGKRIALANKETLVCAGTIVMARAAEKGAEIVPVDSEHSAIFQCLTGRERTELYRILLTGSGGPFRGKPVSELRDITPAQAVKHPNWSMGAKISVDSATMMNKGLEFIEAMYLFACTPDEIQVIIHPESIIHSMVELVDGTVIAQLGVPDMGLPIQLALTWPERGPSMSERLDFAALGKLTFEAPDLAKVPCLGLAMDCARRGGTATAILNAANEVAVALFLQEKIGFTQIYDCVSKALDSMEICSDPNLEEILDADRRARNFVREHFD